MFGNKVHRLLFESPIKISSKAKMSEILQYSRSHNVAKFLINFKMPMREAELNSATYLKFIKLGVVCFSSDLTMSPSGRMSPGLVVI